MGWRENVAKALNLPAGTVTQTEQQIAAQVPASGMTATAMERRAEDYVVPFAPGRPLVPSLINPPLDSGRAAPRRYEFPVAWNLQITEQRVVPFRILREVADGADLVRKCIEVVKSAVSGMDWDVAPLPTATGRFLAENPGIGTAAASRMAREQLAPEIQRAKDFWLMPDRINGLSFPEWVAMAIEEMLVIDALTIYPNTTLDEKNLHSLEILDGATIKPLLDDRGGRPIPPHPAYQQILWGFPRGEFTASADADGEFTADDLIYAPRTRRPYTPYGYSAVERALPVIDLYMKRLQWLRTEFTDGVTPDAFIKTDATYGDNPELLRAYERIMNDDLAGKLEQRRRVRMLADGMDPIFPPSPDAKFSPAFDELLVKQVCSHFGVLPTQIGFAPKGGLGGAGVQEGEQLSAEIIGLRPVILWITDLCNQLSYRFLNMPRDLGFIFANDVSENGLVDAQRRQIQLSTGEITMNEARAEIGYPMFSFPEADMPMVPNNMVPAADVEEIISATAPTVEPEPEAATEDANGTPDLTTPDKSMNPVNIELAAFAKWTKGSRKRLFMFEFLDSQKSSALNALAKNDPNAARELAIALKSSSASVSVGSFVSWGSSGGTARGKIERVVRDGKLNVPDSSFTIVGTEDDPAVLIRVYREGADGWEPTDTRVGHRASTLTRIEALKAADSFTPPDGVRAAAKRALGWIEDGKAGSGFTDTGRKRASDLARGASVSAETIGRMVSFFARHEVDKKAEGFNAGEDGFPSAGRVAWDAWGGDAGKTWAETVSARLNPEKGVKASDAGGRSSAPYLDGGDEAARVDSLVRGAAAGFSWAR